jgi:outer membrane protein assembly factor BamB
VTCHSDTGDVRWTFHPELPPDTVAQPALSPDGRVVYTLSHKGYDESSTSSLNALDAATGIVHWKTGPEARDLVDFEAVNPADGTIYVGDTVK